MFPIRAGVPTATASVPGAPVEAFTTEPKVEASCVGVNVSNWMSFSQTLAPAAMHGPEK